MNGVTVSRIPDHPAICAKAIRQRGCVIRITMLLGRFASRTCPILKSRHLQNDQIAKRFNIVGKCPRAPVAESQFCASLSDFVTATEGPEQKYPLCGSPAKLIVARIAQRTASLRDSPSPLNIADLVYKEACGIAPSATRQEAHRHDAGLQGNR